MSSSSAESGVATQSMYTINPIDLSDEILLHILRFVPITDLILNVKRTCRKFASLCLDKSLMQKVSLHKEYQANDAQVKQMLKEVGSDVCELNMSGCYWLSSPTVDLITRCKRLLRLDLSGCSLTSLRLSKLLSHLHQLRSLAIDVGAGFDSGQLSSECKATLRHVQELKQTIFTPSYGVVPCCTSLEKLLLYFEVLDRTREGAIMSGQLMVGQSNIPHYQNLRLFYARLAPGYVNEEVVRLYLAVLSDRTPENLRAFIISVPGSLSESRATKNLLDSMVKNVSLEAFQLPKTWMNGSSILQHLKFSCPIYLGFSRSMISGGQLTRWVINGHRDCKSLISLNLRGCPFCLTSDLPLRKQVEHLDCRILQTLIIACPNLAHLNLSYAHHHTSESATSHLCDILSRLKRLRSLALPVCAIVDSPRITDKSVIQYTDQSSPRTASIGFGKKVRVGVQTSPVVSFEQNNRRSLSAFWRLLKENPFIEHLELIGSNFYSAMPRNDPAIHNTYPPCTLSQNVGDAQVAEIGQLEFLQNLTLAQLPGIHSGSGLVHIGKKCQHLNTLSLANLGTKGMVVYMASLCEMLCHCRNLKDLRLEEPYFFANHRFFQALSNCSSLQRLCIVSQNGKFQPDAVVSFVSACTRLVMCHIFTGETLKACKSLQQCILHRFYPERQALNVQIFPLLHESLADVIQDVPLIHLDEITLFKSRIAEEPSQLWL
ncbi:hypothetical protein GDO86_017187 [Hymenochirus boettgeri]|uniref:F-box domain-containing protein n=1 Tax=Hymenochirus boettgeri TaxID=247094 RepID=A0A8T2IIS6_9PIPI|nr:hypothetical protein GDO86_017187 [Hymenochirus boettgeri]KAG8432836.1 hypothetical protein GDO86_017187 [Hymenochirus boettgeri]